MSFTKMKISRTYSDLRYKLANYILAALIYVSGVTHELPLRISQIPLRYEKNVRWLSTVARS